MKIQSYIRVLSLSLLLFSCSAEDDSGSSPEPQVPVPGKSSLSAPENNEVCYEGEAVDASDSAVNFSWDASSDTDSYDLQITNQESNQTQTVSGITSTSKEVTLATDISYSWKVVSKANGTNDSTNSDTWQFYLAGDGQENFAPFLATILSPSSGVSVDSIEALTGIDFYHQLDDELEDKLEASKSHLINQ